MTYYTITKNHIRTDLSTPNGIYLLLALEHLRKEQPEYTWDYIVEEILQA